MKRWILIFGLGIALLSVIFYSKPHGNLAVLQVEGEIYDAIPFLKQIDQLLDSEKVLAVVLRVDSPGGAIGASQELYEAVQRLAAKKKVVASFGNIAASGGYYVALPCHKIFTNPGTVTGSIGVRMEHLNIEELLKWARVDQKTLKSGQWKDIGSATRPMTPEERQFLEDVLAKMHRQFKKAVAEGRRLEITKVEELAQGQIFTGEEAKELDLVDEIGSLHAAIDGAARLAGIEGEPDVFYPSLEEDDWIDRLLGEASKKVALEVRTILRERFIFSYE